MEVHARRRTPNVPPLVAAVKKLDVFPKVAVNYQDKTTAGGAVSLLSFGLLLTFLYYEIGYYTDKEIRFKYTIDRDFQSKLSINIDMTIAMPCDAIGADILDKTDQPTSKFGQLTEEETYFHLSANQQVHWDAARRLNTQLREESHALRELLFRYGYASYFGDLPARDVVPDHPPDSCRLYGTLVLNKVAGNFHITAGKSIQFAGGHAHLTAFFADKDFNFSHRIERFSFGELAPGIINPLDADEQIAHKNFQLFQYYVQVVPTEVRTPEQTTVTYQYSVTEQTREIDHKSGSHGIPGIFFKYDVAPIKVQVVEEYRSLWQFAVRMCGVVGGILATSGLLNNVVSWFVDAVAGLFPSQHKAKPSPAPLTPLAPLSPSFNSLLNTTSVATPLLIGAIPAPVAPSPIRTVSQQISINDRLKSFPGPVR